MTSPIKIRPLTDAEMTVLMRTVKFNRLRPDHCKNCGNSTDFARHVFWVGGVPKSERASDSTQSLIAYHMRRQHGIEYVFFKTVRNSFYVDSAVCSQCGSTAIVFDIEFTDDVMAEMAKLTETPVDELRKGIESTMARLAKDAEPEARGEAPRLRPRRRLR